MIIPEQMRAFAGDIENVVERYRHEFNVPACAIVGVLELIKANIINGLIDSADEEE